MLELISPPKPWAKYARCRAADVDPDWWHPEGWDSARTARFAKSLCRSCLVKDTCLAENLHEPEGVWGATLPEERKRLRRRKP